MTRQPSVAGGGGVTLNPSTSDYRGTDDTVALMTRHVYAADTDVAVRRMAEQIVSSLYGKDYLSEAAALVYWVSNQKNIRYTRDPTSVELVKSPRVTLQTRQADCDDIGTLLASFLRHLGVREVGFVTVGFKPDKILTHVYAYFADPRSGRRCVVDPVAGPGTGGMLKRVTAFRIYPPL